MQGFHDVDASCRHYQGSELARGTGPERSSEHWIRTALHRRDSACVMGGDNIIGTDAHHIHAEGPYHIHGCYVPQVANGFETVLY
jgi:hypothetical protein